MKRIYKLQVPTAVAEGKIILKLSKGAVILSFQCQDGVPTIWVMIKADEPKVENRQFRIFDSEQLIGDIPDDANFHYIGTAQEGSGFTGVWHLFEEVKG